MKALLIAAALMLVTVVSSAGAADYRVEREGNDRILIRDGEPILRYKDYWINYPKQAKAEWAQKLERERQFQQESDDFLDELREKDRRDHANRTQPLNDAWDAEMKKIEEEDRADARFQRDMQRGRERAQYEASKKPSASDKSSRCTGYCYKADASGEQCNRMMYESVTGTQVYYICESGKKVNPGGKGIGGGSWQTCEEAGICKKFPDRKGSVTK